MDCWPARRPVRLFRVGRGISHTGCRAEIPGDDCMPIAHLLDQLTR
ncbi:hypothetical protein [Sphaerisporangium aureirubrum]|uniref:Uncharacterized protein n=1 Tax=Sphaerisporangium aureirubrum TaxID=1544736 RepID=A0ABW1NMA1_9ACTN